MKCPYYIKICTKCGKLLVVYNGNFRKDKKGKYGFVSRCKQCDKQYQKQYREEHKDEILEYQKQYREEHKDEIAKQKKQYYEDNKEEMLEYQKQYREEHKEEITEYRKQYYEDNKDEILEKHKQYYEEHKDEKEFKEKRKQYREEHKDEMAEYQKQYYEDNKDEILEKNKQYRENNPHIQLNNHNKRRQLEENQGRGITKEQWYEMMCWFDWCCAYSGEYIGNNSEHRTIDHIIPLNNDGLNESWNCIPCFANYNYSKNTRNMEEWYQQQEFYSEERLIKIYAWCEYAFNKWKPRRKGNKKIT